MAGSSNFKGLPKSSLQEEFEAKNQFLRSKLLELSPSDYLQEVFPDKSEDQELVIVLGTVKDKEGRITEKGTVTRVRMGDIWSIAWRSNAYIPYCDFKRNYYHSKTLDRVRAFVIDCDGITESRLKKIFRYMLSTLPAEPTHVVNSGKGVHFIYLLSQPVEVRGLRWTLNNLNKAIQDKFSEFVEVDRHPLVHPYRFPGFQTKINTVATAFRLREPYSLESLMREFKLIPERKEKPSNEEKKENKAQIIVLPNGRRAFFEWVLRKLFKYPPIPGRRHNSFFALGIVAYKCRREVPYEEAVETIPMVYEDMMDRNLHIGFDIQEAYRAFHKGYDQKYVRARWKYLCELFGWEYRANKRNGRTRKEHCAYMNYIKSAKAAYRRKEVMPIVWLMLEDGLSIRKISSILGIPKSTLSRWIKQEELEL